jgi:hypothetical protein
MTDCLAGVREWERSCLPEILGPPYGACACTVVDPRHDGKRLSVGCAHGRVGDLAVPPETSTSTDVSVLQDQDWGVALVRARTQAAGGATAGRFVAKRRNASTGSAAPRAPDSRSRLHSELVGEFERARPTVASRRTSWQGRRTRRPRRIRRLRTTRRPRRRRPLREPRPLPRRPSLRPRVRDPRRSSRSSRPCTGNARWQPNRVDRRTRGSSRHEIGSLACFQFALGPPLVAAAEPDDQQPGAARHASRSRDRMGGSWAPAVSLSRPNTCTKPGWA